MAINKVVYGSETLIDLTSDTATAADVAQGKTFHLANGTQATGTSTGGGGVQTTWYGVCSLAANTSIKTVTCEGFEPVKGAIIGVLFRYGNTNSSPGLNVNSTGNKVIFIGESQPSSSNTLMFGENSMVFFMYDGAYYRLISQQSGAATAPRGANTWYATSATAAATAAKTGACPNFILTRGAVVAVTFSTANTVTGAITLNLNSSGAISVYANSAAVSASNSLTWSAGATLTFVYSGDYYYLVARSDLSSGGGSSYTLPAATSSTLGGVKVGSGLSITSDGMLSATGGGGGGGGTWTDLDATNFPDAYAEILAGRLENIYGRTDGNMMALTVVGWTSNLSFPLPEEYSPYIDDETGESQVVVSACAPIDPSTGEYYGMVVDYNNGVQLYGDATVNYFGMFPAALTVVYPLM